MDIKRAFYSVVQYVPDGGRAEAANAGVVLFVPSERWLEMRVSPTRDRIRRFFRPGKQELRRIERALNSLKCRLELARRDFTTEEDLAQFIASRADAVRLTPLRLVMVKKPESDLDDLYHKLVGDREGRDGDTSPFHKLPPQVASIIGPLEASGKIWRPSRIRVPTINRPLDVSFAFENGRVSYVRPELLTAKRLNDRLESLSFNGRLIHKHPIDDKPGQLVVLSSDPNADPGIEHRFGETLVEFDVCFVPNAKLEEFAIEVVQTAH